MVLLFRKFLEINWYQTRSMCNDLSCRYVFNNMLNENVALAYIHNITFVEGNPWNIFIVRTVSKLNVGFINGNP